MTASYRLIHFSPDPFSGARFVLGAIVTDEHGEVRAAPAEKLPTAECLGDRGLAVTVQRLHARLGQIISAERLPAVFGPYATLTDARALPSGVADPMAWVRGLLLAPTSENERRLRTPRGVQRSTLGFKFFETYRVAPYVRKTFKPSTDWEGWLGRYATGLQQVTHWAGSEQSVLLMEPVVPARHQFESDIKEIAAKFLSYRHAMEHTENGRAGRLVAYITAGGEPDQRAEAREALEPFAHLIVDTTNATARANFIGQIEQLGGGGRQESLTPEA